MNKYIPFKKLAVASAVGAMLLVSNAVNAHVTYNTTGAPNNPDSDVGAPSWTIGNPGYTGNLPATWVAEIHNDGGVANSQTASSAGAGFAIGIGARSYKDNTTNWAHSADFGLLELHHDATVTITVASDGSDLRPAFGLWSGWDTSGGASRHQKYLNNGALSPMGAVLNSTLSVVDPAAWVFAATQGTTASATLTRFLTAGNYTLILGGYDGTSPGTNLAYTATISAAPVPLPAAVWLFGAGLMGWLGLQKRKMAA